MGDFVQSVGFFFSGLVAKDQEREKSVPGTTEKLAAGNNSDPSSPETSSELSASLDSCTSSDGSAKNPVSFGGHALSDSDSPIMLERLSSRNVVAPIAVPAKTNRVTGGEAAAATAGTAAAAKNGKAGKVSQLSISVDDGGNEFAMDLSSPPVAARHPSPGGSPAAPPSRSLINSPSTALPSSSASSEMGGRTVTASGSSLSSVDSESADSDRQHAGGRPARDAVAASPGGTMASSRPRPPPVWRPPPEHRHRRPMVAAGPGNLMALPWFPVVVSDNRVPGGCRACSRLRVSAAAALAAVRAAVDMPAAYRPVCRRGKVMLSAAHGMLLRPELELRMDMTCAVPADFAAGYMTARTSFGEKFYPLPDAIESDSMCGGDITVSQALFSTGLGHRKCALLRYAHRPCRGAPWVSRAAAKAAADAVAAEKAAAARLGRKHSSGNVTAAAAAAAAKLAQMAEATEAKRACAGSPSPTGSAEHDWPAVVFASVEHEIVDEWMPGGQTIRIKPSGMIFRPVEHAIGCLPGDDAAAPASGGGGVETKDDEPDGDTIAAGEASFAATVPPSFASNASSTSSSSSAAAAGTSPASANGGKRPSSLAVPRVRGPNGTTVSGSHVTVVLSLDCQLARLDHLAYLAERKRRVVKVEKYVREMEWAYAKYVQQEDNDRVTVAAAAAEAAAEIAAAAAALAATSEATAKTKAPANAEATTAKTPAASRSTRSPRMEALPGFAAGVAVVASTPHRSAAPAWGLGVAGSPARRGVGAAGAVATSAVAVGGAAAATMFVAPPPPPLSIGGLSSDCGSEIGTCSPDMRLTRSPMAGTAVVATATGAAVVTAMAARSDAVPAVSAAEPAASLPAPRPRKARPAVSCPALLNDGLRAMRTFRYAADCGDADLDAVARALLRGGGERLPASLLPAGFLVCQPSAAPRGVAALEALNRALPVRLRAPEVEALLSGGGGTGAGGGGSCGADVAKQLPEVYWKRVLLQERVPDLEDPGDVQAVAAGRPLEKEILFELVVRDGRGRQRSMWSSAGTGAAGSSNSSRADLEKELLLPDVADVDGDSVDGGADDDASASSIGSNSKRASAKSAKAVKLLLGDGYEADAFDTDSTAPQLPVKAARVLGIFGKSFSGSSKGGSGGSVPLPGAKPPTALSPSDLIVRSREAFQTVTTDPAVALSALLGDLPGTRIYIWAQHLRRGFSAVKHGSLGRRDGVSKGGAASRSMRVEDDWTRLCWMGRRGEGGVSLLTVLAILAGSGAPAGVSGGAAGAARDAQRRRSMGGGGGANSRWDLSRHQSLGAASFGPDGYAATEEGGIGGSGGDAEGRVLCLRLRERDILLEFDSTVKRDLTLAVLRLKVMEVRIR
ncbi:unnamed protein product [Phaeothamnion confervicola]